MKTAYYFRPSGMADELGRWAQSTNVVAFEALDREAPAGQRLNLPAVVVVDAERDLAFLEGLAPSEDDWRVIYLLDGAAARRGGLFAAHFQLSSAPLPACCA